MRKRVLAILSGMAIVASTVALGSVLKPLVGDAAE